MTAGSKETPPQPPPLALVYVNTLRNVLFSHSSLFDFHLSCWPPSLLMISVYLRRINMLNCPLQKRRPTVCSCRSRMALSYLQ